MGIMTTIFGIIIIITIIFITIMGCGARGRSQPQPQGGGVGGNPHHRKSQGGGGIPWGGGEGGGHGIPPLPVKWVVVLFGLVAFLVFLGGLVWPRPLPPCGVGPVSFWLAPPCLWAGQCVLQRQGMVAAACHKKCHRYVPCGVGPVVLWLARPACVGQCVLQRYGMLAAAG